MSDNYNPKNEPIVISDEPEWGKCHDNCIGKQACLQLVKDGKNRMLKDIEREIFALYPEFNAVSNDIVLIIDSMRVE